MGRAVIVSTARTGLAKSFRGGFNSTHGAVLGGHAIKHAVAKAGIEPAEVEDVFLGCGMVRVGCSPCCCLSVGCSPC